MKAERRDGMSELVERLQDLDRVWDAGVVVDMRLEAAARIEELGRALRDLTTQIERNDFTDSLGHEAKMLKAYHDARAVLEKKA